MLKTQFQLIMITYNVTIPSTSRTKHDTSTNNNANIIHCPINVRFSVNECTSPSYYEIQSLRDYLVITTADFGGCTTSSKHYVVPFHTKYDIRAHPIAISVQRNVMHVMRKNVFPPVRKHNYYRIMYLSVTIFFFKSFQHGVSRLLCLQILFSSRWISISSRALQSLAFSICFSHYLQEYMYVKLYSHKISYSYINTKGALFSNH